MNTVETKLKPYMVYDRHWGSEEGACLVFHFTSRQARYLGFRLVTRHWYAHDYIDVGASLIKNSTPWIYTVGNQEKLKANEPHVIESPDTCRECYMWGNPIDDNDVCEECETVVYD